MQTNSTVDFIFRIFPRFDSSTGVIGCCTIHIPGVSTPYSLLKTDITSDTLDSNPSSSLSIDIHS